MRRFLTLPISIYRLFLSPLLGQNCRYHPTCSAYMKEAILKHGFFKGGWMGFKRLATCHPLANRRWHAKQGYDPVPDKDNPKAE